jgi:hypothetical protein
VTDLRSALVSFRIKSTREELKRRRGAAFVHSYADSERNKLHVPLVAAAPLYDLGVHTAFHELFVILRLKLKEKVLHPHLVYE